MLYKVVLTVLETSNNSAASCQGNMAEAALGTEEFTNNNSSATSSEDIKVDSELVQGDMATDNIYNN